MKTFKEWKKSHLNENLADSRTFRIALMDQDGTVLDSTEILVGTEDEYININPSNTRDPRASEVFEIPKREDR